ncbi:hypothetical protein ACFL5G_05285 [Candidatus Margulisiibacteriota bacterium]
MLNKFIAYKEPSVQMSVTDLQLGYYIVCGRGRGAYRGWILTMRSSNKVININLALDPQGDPLEQTKIIRYTLNNSSIIRVYPLKILNKVDLQQLQQRINGHSQKPTPRPEVPNTPTNEEETLFEVKLDFISREIQIRPTINSKNMSTIEVDVDKQLYEILTKHGVKILCKNITMARMLFHALLHQKNFPSFYNYSLGRNSLFKHLQREIEHYAVIKHEGKHIFQLCLVIEKDKHKDQLEISLSNYSPTSGDPINTPLKFYCLKKL